ncbi:hypothetical protein Zmor_012601 [Zophobas morio]|uniref:Uncharacterized protein n=1 Tax=Zophobas morio TaxID=2755281 RepID=A0AA38IDX2_9CUCU|nr:hypothetical protein Zmor_012601 [Zophobas morio]
MDELRRWANWAFFASGLGKSARSRLVGRSAASVRSCHGGEISDGGPGGKVRPARGPLTDVTARTAPRPRGNLSDHLFDP